MATSFAFKPIVTNGLILCLDAGNTKSYPGSGTTWTDLTSNGNNGTLTNGPTFQSSYGGLIFFNTDGNDVIIIPPTNVMDKITTSFTLSVYLRLTSEISLGIVATNRNTSDYDPTFNLSYDNRALVRPWNPSGLSNQRVLVFTCGGGGINTSYIWRTNSLPLNEWANITVSNNSSILSLYYNGVLSSTGSFLGTLQKPNINIRLGNQYDNGLSDYPLTSSNISNVQIYNRALSASEVLQNYNATKGRFV
jgi:hypothetical protein